jgi:hypothetical protein
MRISRNSRLQGLPLVFKPDDVRKLCRCLEKYCGTVSIVAECEDRLTRHFGNAESLLSFENAPANKICLLQFSASSDNQTQMANLEFDGQYGFNSLHRIFLDGSEEIITKLNSEIEQRLQGMKPWYSQMTTHVASLVIFFSCLVMTILAISSFALTYRYYDPTNQTKPSQLLVIGGGVIFPLTIILLLEKIRDRFFPLVTFALGQGEERYKTDENIRWMVIFGFVVSFMAGLVLLLFSLSWK